MSRIETYKKSQPSKRFLVLGLLGAFLLIASSLVLLLYPFPSNEKANYFTTSNPIIFKGKTYEDALVKDNNIYFPLSFIKEAIDPSIVYEEKSDSIIIATNDKVIRMKQENLQYFLNEKPFELEVPTVTSENGTVYLSLTPLEGIYPIRYERNKETGAVMVEQDGEIKLTGSVKKDQTKDDLKLRQNPDPTSPYVETVKGEEILFIEEDAEEEYYFARKANGVAGYIKKQVVSLKKPEVVKVEKEEQPRPAPRLDGPINLTWEAVYTKTPSPDLLPEMPGVNVVSPTWFHIKNKDGDISNKGSSEYVNWAKNNGMQIWGLFSNSFDPELTHETLQDYETRQKMIRQILQYSQMYELDGINVDFENVNPEDSHLVTQFMRELTVYLHHAGLIVSMDITFISESGNWSKFYEREKLADIVDYLIVMAYDEHWATSPESGSVASFPWVKKNLETLLEVVPNDRLILGIPLYARIWTETETEGGNIEVSSKAYKMDEIQEWLKEHNLKPTLDPESGQYYAEYRDAKSTYKVWIENDYSLHKRVQLVHQYRLAGVGTWSRYFGSDNSWSVMQESLKKIDATK